MSFWAPWLAQMPDVTYFCDQPIEEIMATMDPYLISVAIEFKELIDKEVLEVQDVLKKYPELFNNESIKEFRAVYAQVWTRCFGYNLPSTGMVPMADNFNHSDIRAGYEIIAKSLHKQ